MDLVKVISIDCVLMWMEQENTLIDALWKRILVVSNSFEYYQYLSKKVGQEFHMNFT